MDVYSKSWKAGLIVLLALLCFCAQGYAATIRVAIVKDCNSSQESLLIENLRLELEKLNSEQDNVLIPEDLQFSGENNKTSIERAIKEAFASKKANAVLCTGPLGSHILSKQKKFLRPAFAAQVLNASAQQIVFAKDSKSKRKLNLINFNLDLNTVLDTLQQIRRVEKLAVVVSRNWISILPELPNSLIESATNQGLKAELVEAEKIGANRTVLKGYDAAIVFPLSESEQLRVAAELKNAQIIAMSLLGAKAVENGLFACVFPDIDLVKLSRRLALNLQRLLFNEDPAQYESNYSLPMRLHLNMQTAREIKVFPTWAQMTDAILYFAEPEDIERRLSLTEVMQMAVVRNLQLAAKQQEIEANRHGIDRARANLRPKVNIFARENVLDEDRASTIMTPAKYTTQIGADLMQVIYNEPAHANIDIQKLMLAAKRDEEKALILDIMRDAALAYLNVLKAKTMQTIQRDNLEVTRANLDIARFREEVGTSGPAEVYRWEIQMASARQAVIDASVMRKKAELALNQILNSSQEEEFTTADDDIFATVFKLDTQKVAPYIDNVFGFKVFRDFLVEHTFAQSPEIMQIKNNIEAQKRALLSARRRYNQPTVAIQGNFTRTLKESGPGEPKPPMPSGFSNYFSYPDKNDWFIGLNVSLPLYEGGDRPASVNQIQAIINQLENNHKLLLQRLELNTRIALEDARSSFASIGLSNTRSEYAAKTLELVQSAYQRGAVNILDLIDAQNASLVSKEAVANAMFNFFSDFVKVCRAVGSFDFILKPETQQEWQEKLQNYYQENAADAVVYRKPPVIQPSIGSKASHVKKN